MRFFREQSIPFWRMRARDERVGATSADASRYCFAADGETSLVYLSKVGTAAMDWLFVLRLASD